MKKILWHIVVIIMSSAFVLAIVAFICYGLYPALVKADTENQILWAKKQAQELATNKTYEVITADPRADGGKTLVLEDPDTKSWILFDSCTDEQASVDKGDKVSLVFTESVLSTKEGARKMKSCYLGISRPASH